MRTGNVPILDWITTAELARLACVDRSTAGRWRRGERPAPAAVLQLVEMYHGGHVGPRAGLAWRGWYFDTEGLLNAPDMRAAIDAPELRAWLYLRRQGLPPAAAHTLMTGMPGAR
jgi:hypothetical protein